MAYRFNSGFNFRRECLLAHAVEGEGMMQALHAYNVPGNRQRLDAGLLPPADFITGLMQHEALSKQPKPQESPPSALPVQTAPELAVEMCRVRSSE